MSSNDFVSHSVLPTDESYYDDEASDDNDDDEIEADLREYGLAPSLPTSTAKAFADDAGDDDDDEIVVDDSKGFSAALRYLASVRLEAKTIPQTVIAESREGEGQGQERREMNATDREQAPSAAAAFLSSPTSSSASASSASDAVSLADPWLQDFLDDFAEVRRRVIEAREVEHRDAWKLGAVEGKKKKTNRKTDDEDGDGDHKDQLLPRSWRAALGLSRKVEQETPEPEWKSPRASYLASLPQPEIVEALECVVEAVREFLEEMEEEDEEEAEEGEEVVAAITPSVALWAFSLAANLERPVPPHASAALSALGKAAGAEAKRIRRTRRRALSEDDKAPPPPSSPPFAASSPCPHAAIVAAVCGAYFVQCEELSRAAKEGWP